MSAVCPTGCAVCSLGTDGATATCVVGKCKERYVQAPDLNCISKYLTALHVLVCCHQAIISSVIIMYCIFAFL